MSSKTLHEHLRATRAIKTNNIKQLIKETIKSLYEQNISPTRYQIHKRTNIAYVTLKKYYEEALSEVRA